MSTRYPGGLISSVAPVPTGGGAQDSAPGVWTLDQADQYIATQEWPGTGIPDPQFQYVTALLHGDGTNGGQNNTFLDSSSNNFSITRNGNTTQGSFSPYGNLWSNFFDGSGDYFTAPSGSAFQFGTGNFTLEAWVYATALGSYNSICGSRSSSGDGSAANYSWVVQSNGSVLFYAGSFLLTSAAGSVALNTWTHVAFVRSGTGTNQTTVYINGIPSASATVSNDLTGNAFSIGALGNGSEPFTGYISNLRVVKGTAVYTSAFTPSTTPLTAITNTSILTCQSNRFIDNSSNAFALTVNGNPSVQRFSPFQNLATYQPAVIGGSGFFDGSGDYLTLAANSAWSLPGNFTWECWAYPTNLSATPQRILHQGSTGTQKMIFYIDNSSGGFNFYYDGGSNFIVSSINLRANAWNHIAGVRNGSTITLYINGVSAGTATSSATLGDSSLGFAIGSNGGTTDQFPGYISDVRLVKGTAVYTSAFSPPTAPVTNITNTSLLTNFTNGSIFDSDASNNFETVGNAQISTSVVKYGTGSMAFDGTGDWLAAPSNPAYAFGTGNFTIEAWIYFNSVANASFATTNTTNGFYWQFFSSSLAFGRAGGGTDISRSWSPIANTWYHVATVRVGNTITHYINGTSIGSGTFTDSISATTTLQIGTGGAGSLNGYIDDFRISTGYARYWYNFQPPTRAFPNYGGTVVEPLEDPLFENVTLLLNGNGTNGAQNNTFLDSSTNNFTITRNGNTTQGSFSPYGNLWSNFFNGSSNLQVANNAAFDFGSGNFTIECWVNCNNIASGTQYLCGKSDGATASGSSFLLSANNGGGGSGFPDFGFYVGGSAFYVTGATPLTNGVWNHLAVVRNGNVFTLYLNGNQTGTLTNSSTLNTVTQPFTVAESRASGGSPFNGYISNLRVVKGTALYTSAFTPSTTPLTVIANTSILTCADNRFIDDSTNNFTLTVNGSPSVQRFSPFEPTAPYSTSVIGGSGYFDGTTANLITSSTVGTIGTGDFSFEAWVYATSAAGYAGIVGNDAATFLEFGSVRGFFFGGPELSGGAIRYNQWVHLAVCRTSGTASMYLNGTRTNTASWTNNLSTAIAIGVNNYVTGTTTGAGITGYIASPRVFIGSSAYNAASTTITIPTTPPAATGATYLPAMTNAGIPDLAMQNNLQTVGNAQVSTAQSKFGGSSLLFDGTGDFLKAPNSPVYQLGSGNFTLEAWVYVTQTSGSVQTLIAKGTGLGNQASYVIQLNTSGTWVYNISNNGATWSFSDVSIGTNTLNTWQHIALVRNGNTFTPYLNGVAGTITTTSLTLFAGTAPFTVGADDAGNNLLYGYVQDLRVTNGIARYVQPFTPPTQAFQTY
jgi:hypothetical protein